MASGMTSMGHGENYIKPKITLQDLDNLFTIDEDDE
jgi:hypothetical protein